MVSEYPEVDRFEEAVDQPEKRKDHKNSNNRRYQNKQTGKEFLLEGGMNRNGHFGIDYNKSTTFEISR